MLQTAEVTELVFNAISEINEQLPREGHLVSKLETILIGPASPLDSLGLVNLIVTVEQDAEIKWGVALMLFDAMSAGVGETPFNTVGTLVDYINQRIAKSATA
jgi:acyl carrier protein